MMTPRKPGSTDRSTTSIPSAGILTPEEFEAKNEQTLNRM